jgi:hypothetical protein
MARSNADLLAIKAELTNDPLTLGLTILAADDEANANKLNEVRTTIQVDRESVPVSDVVKAIDADEFIALSQPQRDYVALITNGGTVNPKNGGEVREALLQFFSAQSETRASLILLLTEAGSRITQLFKAGTLQQGGIVTPSDIAGARNAV